MSPSGALRFTHLIQCMSINCDIRLVFVRNCDEVLNGKRVPAGASRLRCSPNRMTEGTAQSMQPSPILERRGGRSTILVALQDFASKAASALTVIAHQTSMTAPGTAR